MFHFNFFLNYNHSKKIRRKFIVNLIRYNTPHVIIIIFSKIYYSVFNLNLFNILLLNIFLEFACMRKLANFFRYQAPIRYNPIRPFLTMLECILAQETCVHVEKSCEFQFFFLIQVLCTTYDIIFDYTNYYFFHLIQQLKRSCITYFVSNNPLLIIFFMLV